MRCLQQFLIRKGDKIMKREIETAYGKISGQEQDHCIVYRGIPYARPPIGELRWKAPQRMDPWKGVYEAVKFSAKCPQSENQYGLYGKEFYSSPDFSRRSDEDCLYLNIWTPRSGGSKKPVAFWIHGGAFAGGYSSEVEFDGEEYCKRGMILITINYRLNIYGFLAHPWLNAENEQSVSGNYGILDQIAALTWVYENIENFGGDPNNITVFGQSAGSMSVRALISTELTGNRISKAILQSGGGYQTNLLYTPTLKEAEAIGERFAAYAHATNLEALRKLSVSELGDALQKLEEELWKSGNGIVFVPNIDGCLLEDNVDRLLECGAVKDIPYLLGAVRNDPGSADEQHADGAYGELLEGCREFSFRLEELGRNPAYVYHFSHPLPGDDAGAFHSSELWYMFGTLGRCWRPMEDSDYKLSEEMIDCWVKFMQTGSLSEDTAEWRPCTKQDAYVREFR